MSDDLFSEYETIEGESECLEEEEEETESKSKSKKEKEKIDAIFTIDSEWGKNEKFLTLQLFVQIRGYENLLFVYYNAEQKELFETNQKNYLLTYQKRIKNEDEEEVPTPVFVPWNYNPTRTLTLPGGEKQNQMIFEEVVSRISERLGFCSEDLLNIQLNFFSSVVDLYHLFSKEIIEPLFTNNFSFMRNNFVTKKTQF